MPGGGVSTMKGRGRGWGILTGIRVAVHARDFKFVEADDPLEAYVALEVLSLVETRAGIRRHTDNDPRFVVGRGWRIVVLFVDRQGGIVELENNTDVVLVGRERIILESFEV
jgi:hypothetical protein